VTLGNAVVEPFGTGDLCLANGAVFRPRFRARVQYKCNRCKRSVLDVNLFEVWKSDRAKWIGHAAEEAWVQVDAHFAEDR
jgi:hypothetical protein